MHLRKQVRAFAEMMETQLRKHDKNRGKRGWKDGEPVYLMQRMIEEIAEVVEEISPHDQIGKYLADRLASRYDYRNSVNPKHPDKLCRELADVANLAMMLADVTFEDFCPDVDEDDKIECAMTREQWDDIINLRGVVVGCVGSKALRDLGNALGATWDTSQWPDAKVER